MENTIDTIFLEGSIKRLQPEKGDSKKNTNNLYIVYPSYYYDLRRIIKEVREYFTLERKVA